MPRIWWGGKYPFEFGEADQAKRATFSHHRKQLEAAYGLAIGWNLFDFYLSEGSAATADGVSLLPTYECRADAMGSILLASFGHYKPAQYLLRSILELAFLAVHLKSNPNDVAKAELGDLKWSTIRDSVLDHHRTRAYATNFLARGFTNLARQVESSYVKDLYGSLSYAVHSRIDMWDILAGGFQQGPRYTPGRFRSWNAYFAKVHHLVYLLLFLHYPVFIKYIEGPLLDDVRISDDWIRMVTPCQKAYVIKVS